ncbi:MAG: hypothetical protein JW855_00725, partial [Gammaproteobacteria bacterium]|nr:hypothetical protein [Gammaproteobacteria bacterium]
MARKIFRSLFCILSIVSAILFIAPNIYGDTPRNGLALVPAGNAASSASSQDFNDSAPNTFSQTSVQKQAQIQEINQLENSAGSDNSQGIQLHHQSLDQVLNHIPNTGNGNLAQQQHSEIDQLVNEIAKTPDQNIPATEAQINQYQFNFGPGVQIGGEYSSEFGPILNTKWGYQFRNNMAGVVEGDIGPKEYRLGLTWAYMLTAHQEMKITLEHLAQKMKFDFATGDIKKWINQNAIGADYEYLFSNKRFFDQVTLNSLGISGYYSKVGSQSFKTKVFQQDDYWYLDYRRIAGGTSKELQLNVGFLPWRWGSVKLGAGYSAVDYDMKYEKDKKSSGLGGSVDLEQ